MRLAVVVVHGLGWQEPGFADGLAAAVSRRLARGGHDPGQVAWSSVLWADVLERRQRDYLERARAAGPLRWSGLRTFVVRGLGDAAAYRYVDGPSSTYVRVHDRVRARVRELYEGPLGSVPVPLVVLAHSLGSHIMSSYVWDTQHRYPTGAAAAAGEFERMEWLAGMVTFGSTIPLFTFAHDPVETIRFPGAALPPQVAERARWLNFYDRDDILGYPLKPTSQSYADLVHADVEVNIGNLLTAATPLMHNSYWTDASFTDPVADYLATLL